MSHISILYLTYKQFIMKDKNNCNKKFEELIFINIISKYIDKYIIKFFYRLLKLIKKL